MKLVRINRSEWGIGALVESSDNDIKCALGHYLSQVHKLSDDHMAMEGHHGVNLPYKWVSDVTHVNDSVRERDYKEWRLEELFAARGVRLEFYGGKP